MNCGKNVRLKPTNKVMAATRDRLRIEPASDLRPPEMQAGDVAHDSAADHNVVKVRDDEVGIVDVNIQAEAGEEEAGEAADHEEADETEGVKHRRVPRDRTFVKGGGPIKDL